MKHLEETSEQRNAIVRAYANVAAKGARQALEGWHAGFSPAPGGRVEWSGGSCLYTDAARLSKGSLRALTLASSTLAEKNLKIFSDTLLHCPESASLDRVFTAGRAFNWDDPHPDPSLAPDIERFAFDKRTDPIFLAGSVRTFCNYSGVLGRPLEPFLTGDLTPAKAAARGADVFVETVNGRKRWDETSHAGDRDMKAINVANHNAMHTIFQHICKEYIQQDRRGYVKFTQQEI